MKLEPMIKHIASTSKLEYDKLVEFFEGIEEGYDAETLYKQVGFTQREFYSLVSKLKKYAKIIDNSL